MSLKEAVRIAQSNNLMGLICTSRLLELVPALVASVKEAGLVLISDYSHDVRHSTRGHSAAPSVLGLGEGVDGLVAGNGVLRFREAVDWWTWGDGFGGVGRLGWWWKPVGTRISGLSVLSKGPVLDGREWNLRYYTWIRLGEVGDDKVGLINV
jgi:hypothetical protein